MKDCPCLVAVKKAIASKDAAATQAALSRMASCIAVDASSDSCREALHFSAVYSQRIRK